MGLWLGLVVVVGSLVYGFVPYQMTTGSRDFPCSGPLAGGHLLDGELGRNSMLGTIEDDPRNAVCRQAVPVRLGWVLGLVGLGVALAGSSWLAYARDPDWEWLGYPAV
jgi:hypothetical protein